MLKRLQVLLDPLDRADHWQCGVRNGVGTIPGVDKGHG